MRHARWYVLALGALLLAGCIAPPPPPPPPQDTIVFVSGRTGNPEIWSMRSDGSEQRQLTNSPEREHDPKLSPDGTRIVFVRQTVATGTAPRELLWVMNADGTDQHQVFAPPETLPGPPVRPGLVIGDRDPAWSGDGTQIAFVREGLTATGILVMNADGTGGHVLVRTGEPYRETDLAWSPDGTKIAHAHAYIGPAFNHVLVADVDGSGSAVGELTGFHNPSDTRTFDEQPAWSPDSSQIAFYGNLLGQPVGTWVINADGSNPTALTDGSSPTWSPDGSRIAFVRGDSIWTMRRDGTDQISLTTGEQPSWGPRP